MFGLDRDDCDASVEVVLFRPDGVADLPLWNANDGRVYRLDELPLTAELRAELEVWTCEATALLDRCASERVALRLIGQRLCARTAEGLGPSYVVHWSWDT